jgi:hypothetical protein
MTFSVTHFLSHLFPELEHPRYHTAAEIVSFIIVATALIGLLAASVFLVVDKL